MLSFTRGLTRKETAVNSLTKVGFQEEKDRDEPSKIISFLWHQIAQQEIMKISLKITELKFSRAMRIICWKSRDKSQ
jgi:hypothetical protein